MLAHTLTKCIEHLRSDEQFFQNGFDKNNITERVHTNCFEFTKPVQEVMVAEALE